MELVAPQNVFTLMLHTRENPSELDLMFEGMVRLLGSVPLAADTFLPASHPSVDFHQEALILLWRMVSVNCRFRRRVCERDDTNTLVLRCRRSCEELERREHTCQRRGGTQDHRKGNTSGHQTPAHPTPTHQPPNTKHQEQ